MGFLTNFLFEETPTEQTRGNVVVDDLIEPLVESDVVPVNPEILTLVEDIYKQNELSDLSSSIFKVEELINSLPKEMVTDTKRASVLATLGVFGLELNKVEEDGEQRVNLLNTALQQLTDSGNELINSKEQEIEEHKKEIVILEKEILEQKEQSKQVKERIDTEVYRISALLMFLVGGNA